MSEIEVKATFKNCNIKENGTVMSFELSPFFMGELPNIAKLTGAVVFLRIAPEQQDLPIENDPEVQALPLDEEAGDIEEVEYEFEAPALPESDGE